METGTIVTIVCIGFLCFLLLGGGIGLIVYFSRAIKAWFSSLFSLPNLDAFSCTNPPCKEGEGCLQGAGKCGTGLFCNAGSKCEKKKPDGAYCPGIAANDYCQSGKCGTLSTCLTSDGYATMGASCSVVDQCDQKDKVNGPLWCGGIPIKCRKLGDVGDYCPLDSSKCKAGLYCASDSTCSAPREDGAGCFTNSACKSGKCGKSNTCLTKDGYMANWSGVCGSDSDCVPGNKCSAFGGRGAQCQPLSVEGGSCTTTTGCAPGLWCSTLSTCSKKKPHGSYCPLNNNACEDGYCTAGSTCANIEGTAPAGKVCGSDWECVSGLHCIDGKCSEAKSAGGTCYNHSDCVSGACGWIYGDDTGRHCCASGSQNYNLRQYCNNLPDGTRCLSNAMCANGSCVNNVCSSKKNEYDNCSANSECKSNACAFKTDAGYSANQAQCCRGDANNPGKYSIANTYYWCDETW